MKVLMADSKEKTSWLFRITHMFEDTIIESLYWSMCRHFDEWIYPAYYLRNLLFNRYDLVKMPQLKPYEYCDISERVLYANMALLVEFVDEEKCFAGFVSWYDEEWSHKLDGVFVGDIIKDIYNWWKVELPLKQKEDDYLLTFTCDYVWGKHSHKPTEQEGFVELYFDTTNFPKCLDDLKDKDIDWSVLDKYVDRKRIFEEHYMSQVMQDNEKAIDKEKEAKLILLMRIRQSLWT